MRETIEILCNECLRPLGNIVDVVEYKHNGLTSVRVERVDCECGPVHPEIADCGHCLKAESEIATLRAQLAKQTLADRIKSAARVNHVK